MNHQQKTINKNQNIIKMKTKIIMTALIGLPFFLNSCDNLSTIVPKDNITRHEFSYADYDRIETESAFTIYLSFSDTDEKIIIETNDNLHQYIQVEQVSGALKIAVQDNINISGSSTLNAYITTKHVTVYSASEASRFIVSDPISSNDANIFLAGASSFTGELKVENLTADLSDASKLIINGNTDSFDLNATGASLIEDYEFITKYLDLNLSDASNASLTVIENMDVVVSGASTLRYKGEGTISSQNIKGGSSITKVD
jgi:hypothetical protein